MKITGEFIYDETLPIIKNNNMFKFIKDYAIIKYKDGNVMKEINSEIKEIKPRKTKIENIYFIEVPTKMKDSENIVIEFNIRNHVYSYIIK